MTFKSKITFRISTTGKQPLDHWDERANKCVFERTKKIISAQKPTKNTLKLTSLRRCNYKTSFKNYFPFYSVVHSLLVMKVSVAWLILQTGITQMAYHHHYYYHYRADDHSEKYNNKKCGVVHSVISSFISIHLLVALFIIHILYSYIATAATPLCTAPSEKGVFTLEAFFFMFSTWKSVVTLFFNPSLFSQLRKILMCSFLPCTYFFNLWLLLSC